VAPEVNHEKLQIEHLGSNFHFSPYTPYTKEMFCPLPAMFGLNFYNNNNIIVSGFLEFGIT